MSQVTQLTRDAAGNVLATRQLEDTEVVVRPEEVNLAGSLAAAKALAQGKSLEEAMAIGAAADPNDLPPAGDDASQTPAGPAGQAGLRRYLSARILATRHPDELTDPELEDAALIVDLPFVSPAIWKARIEK